MSAFGGDSWAREAQNRKRRVDDLMLQHAQNNKDDHSYKKLSNGKFACLVCPNNPVFDSSLTLSMHNKVSRHIAAESKLKEKELMRQEELKKRIALSENSVLSGSLATSNLHFKLKGSPLIERTRKAASEILISERSESTALAHHDGKSDKASPTFFPPCFSLSIQQRPELHLNVSLGYCGPNDETRGLPIKPTGSMTAERQLEVLQRREKELKFTAAGWKRDCHGKWFRDENVEFDSDEEDPNVSLS